ncbi:MAG: hypothetical protein HY819_12400 [Acidobacteria bacterium]|nr:hypothetical protein [Acidobacteriota bacterium]
MQIYSFQQEIINREDLLYQYAIALDRDDASTLAKILLLANNDPKLAELINEINAAFDYDYNLSQSFS